MRPGCGARRKASQGKAQNLSWLPIGRTLRLCVVFVCNIFVCAFPAGRSEQVCFVSCNGCIPPLRRTLPAGRSWCLCPQIDPPQIDPIKSLSLLGGSEGVDLRGSICGGRSEEVDLRGSNGGGPSEGVDPQGSIRRGITPTPSVRGGRSDGVKLRGSIWGGRSTPSVCSRGGGGGVRGGRSAGADPRCSNGGGRSGGGSIRRGRGGITPLRSTPSQ